MRELPSLLHLPAGFTTRVAISRLQLSKNIKGTYKAALDAMTKPLSAVLPTTSARGAG